MSSTKEEKGLASRSRKSFRLLQVQAMHNWLAVKFDMGFWTWCLEINGLVDVSLYPCQVVSDATSATPNECTATFTIRLILNGSSSPIWTDTAVDVIFKEGNPHYEQPRHDIRRLSKGHIVEVEFHDLKASFSKDEKPHSIWTTSLATTTLIQSQALPDISEILDNGTHTDVMITTSDGSLRAHRAILASRSKVFDKMFTHKMKETLSSTIELTDMTRNECLALLRYMYGCLLKQKDIEEHTSALLKASMKYDLAGLKEVCQTCLSEGIGARNVLTRLRVAVDYQLQQLKVECMYYLFDYGKIRQIMGEVSAFIRESNKKEGDEIGMEIVDKLIKRMSPALFEKNETL